MDAAQAVLMIGGGGSTMVVIGIAIGRSQTAAKELARLAKKFHDFEDWRNATLPKEYVSRDKLADTLKPITDTMHRIETQQADMAIDVKTVTRWIDSHGGAGV